MNRRELLLSIAGSASASFFLGTAGSRRLSGKEQGRSALGACVYCLGLHARAKAAQGGPAGPDDPLDFLRHCRTLGAGGIQAPLGVRDKSYALQLRRQAEDFGMFVEGIAALPLGHDDVEQWDAELGTAKLAGAEVIRVVMIPGRRYERFGSADEFREFAARGLRSLQLAEPIAARRRVRLAVENHKDQRTVERLEVLQRLSSEYVGACVDTGNSFALLEDPLETVAAYAPWALSVHLKDQAVCECQDGFLFADAPLGEGFLDLGQMVRILRNANSNIRFNLEVITRDPLKVPCLMEKYWATLADVPGSDLARTLRIVRAHAVKDLPQVSHLPLQEQIALEEENVSKCFAYARERLGL